MLFSKLVCEEREHYQFIWCWPQLLKMNQLSLIFKALFTISQEEDNITWIETFAPSAIYMYIISFFYPFKAPCTLPTPLPWYGTLFVSILLRENYILGIEHWTWNCSKRGARPLDLMLLAVELIRAQTHPTRHTHCSFPSLWDDQMLYVRHKEKSEILFDHFQERSTCSKKYQPSLCPNTWFDPPPASSCGPRLPQSF